MALSNKPAEQPYPSTYTKALPPARPGLSWDPGQRCGIVHGACGQKRRLGPTLPPSREPPRAPGVCTLPALPLLGKDVGKDGV